jgi:hypothetical protein
VGIEDMDIRQNQNREKINFIFWLSKTIFFVAFLIAIFISTLIKFNSWGLEFLNVAFTYWIFGFIISYLIGFFPHLINFFITLKVMYELTFPYDKIISKLNMDTSSIVKFMINIFIASPVDTEGITKTTKKINTFVNLFYRLFSPDYFYANAFKSLLWDDLLNIKCKKQTNKKDKTHDCKLLIVEPALYECELLNKKDRRKDFIIFSNWTNVIISCLLVVLALVCKINTISLKLIFTVIIFRVLSRIIEIIIAFYQDVVRAKMDKDSLEIGYRSSNLKRGHRISLAFHSYVEIVILYSLIYLLSKDLGYFYTVSSNDMKSYLDFFLYSMSVSAFNFSFTMDFTTFQKLIHISQVFSNITLVVLSIASYIGMKDNMSPIEKKRWKDNN